MIDESSFLFYKKHLFWKSLLKDTHVKWINRAYYFLIFSIVLIFSANFSFRYIFSNAISDICSFLIGLGCFFVFFIWQFLVTLKARQYLGEEYNLKIDSWFNVFDEDLYNLQAYCLRKYWEKYGMNENESVRNKIEEEITKVDNKIDDMSVGEYIKSGGLWILFLIPFRNFSSTVYNQVAGTNSDFSHLLLTFFSC